MAKRIDDKELLRRIDIRNRLGREEASRVLGLSLSSLDHLDPTAVGRGLTLPERSERQENADIIERTLERRLLDEIKGLRSERDNLLRSLNSAEDFHSIIFSAINRKPKTPWKVSIKPSVGGQQIPVLFTSDFQWGEYVCSTDMGGVNQFDYKIGTRRYKCLIASAIDLATNHMVKPNYPGIIYLRGGDAVSGLIHDELESTNDRTPPEAVMDLIDLEAEGIRNLADAFGKVEVHSIPGNHGRIRQKKRAKGYVRDNFETIISWALERDFSDDRRVSFNTPLSGEALFDLWGRRAVLSHGDRMGTGGGQGFVGPVAPIARGMKKLVDHYAALGQVIDYIFVGHFHVSLRLEHGWSNGSLPGFSEYALAGRMRPHVPKQWLIFFHPRWGPTAQWEIALEDSMGQQATAPSFQME